MKNEREELEESTKAMREEVKEVGNKEGREQGRTIHGREQDKTRAPRIVTEKIVRSTNFVFFFI